MLAASFPKGKTPEEVYEELRYPVLGTPKLDGIRCLISDSPVFMQRPITRSMSLVPNVHMRTMLSKLPVGLDGELVAPGIFQNSQSAVMSVLGKWDFTYYVFDVWPCEELYSAWQRSSNTGYQIPYTFRMEYLQSLSLPSWCVPLLPTTIQRGELAGYTDGCLEKGYEGSIIRTPLSPYKYGRSTFREQWMVKVKQFVDDEALVIGYEEEMHNANEAKVNELGYKERSSHQANMVGKDRLGALVVNHPSFGEFRVGSGFCAEDRVSLWRDRESLKGRIITFRYQPQGVKHCPRIPVFKCFRDSRDMTVAPGQKELL